MTETRVRSPSPDHELWGDEAVLEFDPPRRLVYGWRSLYDEEINVVPWLLPAGAMSFAPAPFPRSIREASS